MNLESPTRMRGDVVISALTGVRGVLAPIVVLGHYYQRDNHEWLLRNGYRMPFFFMLSGFVMQSVFSGRLVSGKLSWKRFLYDRLSRLYPVFALSILVVAPLELWRIAVYWHNGSVGPACVRSWCLGISPLFLVPTILPSGNFLTLNVPAWYLFAEIGCLILFPVLTRLVSLRYSISTVVVSILLTVCTFQLSRVTLFLPQKFPFGAGNVLQLNWENHAIANLRWFVLGIMLCTVWSTKYFHWIRSRAHVTTWRVCSDGCLIVAIAIWLGLSGLFPAQGIADVTVPVAFSLALLALSGE